MCPYHAAPRRAVYHSNRAAAYLARAASPGGGRGASDESGHLEDTMFTAEDTTASAAELNVKAALMDCDAALEMQPGHVKAKFRKATALYRLGRVEEAGELTRHISFF